MALLLGKTEDIRISENLLEERQLALCVLPVSVYEVHGKQSLKPLGLKSKLKSFHEQDQSLSVFDLEKKYA